MTRIVAHLIVGNKPEPFLPALLDSIDGAIERLFVNETSGEHDGGPNTPALHDSRLARDGRLVITHTSFVDFSTARNVCFALDIEADENTWIVFIDADEVHGERFARIAKCLYRLPKQIAYVDGYTWHFFQSYDWYASIERRMSFFRWTPQAHWEGKVHEKLTGVPGKRLALPYVYAHYGHVMPFLWASRKGLLYSALGAPGVPLDEHTALNADRTAEYEDVESFFAPWWSRLMRFRGAHPPTARAIIARDRIARAEHFGKIDEIVRRHQPPLVRMRNAVRQLNYAQRWRLRALTASHYRLL